MKISKVWFDNEYIYVENSDGETLRQSLLWYENLKAATDEQRSHYTIGHDGLHWRELDEDVSFESFSYPDADPSRLQRFFLTHKEINVAEFAKRIGMNPTLLRNYINGFKSPSKEREEMILDCVAELGEEYVALRHE